MGLIPMISEQGLNFIKGWEKFRPRAYKDQAGIWTIGFGTTKYGDESKVKKGDIITLDEALVYLQTECIGISTKIDNWIVIPILQHEFDALISLSYNIGTQGFKTSTLLRQLNKNEQILENYFTRWNKVHIDGKLVQSKGLTSRRKSEFKLFSRGVY